MTDNHYTLFNNGKRSSVSVTIRCFIVNSTYRHYHILNARYGRISLFNAGSKFMNTFLSSWSLQFDLKAWTLPDSLPILIEDPRDRTHGYGDECEQGIPPAQAEGVVHLLPGQRE